MERTPPGAAARKMAGTWLPVLVCAALIFVASSFTRIPLVGNRLFRYDKVAHLVEYAVMGGLLLRALRGAGALRGLLVALALAWGLVTLFGASDELHQHFVPGRHGDPFDLIADAVGALTGCGLYLAVTRRARRKKSSPGTASAD